MEDFLNVTDFFAGYRVCASPGEVLDVLLRRHGNVDPWNGAGDARQDFSNFRTILVNPVAFFLTIWLRLTPEDFREPPYYTTLNKLLASLRMNMPGSKLLKDAEHLLQRFQREEVENENNPGELPGDQPGDTLRDHLGDPTGDQPGDPSRDQPGDELGDMPRDQPRDQPGDPSRDQPGDPSGDQPGDELGDMPRDHPRDQPGDPSRDKPGDPSGDQPGDELGNMPGDQPGDQPRDPPRDQPGDPSGDQPRDKVGDMPREQPRDQPRDPSGDELGDEPGHVSGDQLRDQPRDSPKDQPRDLSGDQLGDVPGDQPGDQPRDLPRDKPGDLPKNLPHEKINKCPVTSTPCTSCDQQTRDTCLIRGRMENSKSSVCKTILVTCQDRTDDIIKRVMAEHNLDPKESGNYQLVQLISETKALVFPDGANVYYGMNSQGRLDFIVRERRWPIIRPGPGLQKNKRGLFSLFRKGKRGSWKRTRN
ncbi:ral guanine nucleotide dissociation stimulator-like 1 [Alligator mississippiensis]|uniref:ral guanine nucleotide dissociation stimulator-like 1 n=1 Tax=Alligator mississippiensis TaxID=8496 RepID=UPI002877F8DE|nr:ral guanine nucleotide dissociation stimulator-like 1 [Alligator mississippiensis]